MPQLSKTSRAILRRSTLVAAITLAFVGSADASYINDGSFESPVQGYSYLAGGAYTWAPTVPGVTFSGDNTSGIAAQGSFATASPPDGSQYGFIRNNGGSLPGYIFFDVTGLTVGDTYNISFLAAKVGNYGVDPILLAFNSLALGTFTPTSSTTFTGYTSANFVAASSTGSLQFVGLATTGDFVYTDLDNVVINAVASGNPGNSAVPEPAPIALLGLGLVGAVFSRRRSVAAKIAA